MIDIPYQAYYALTLVTVILFCVVVLLNNINTR